MQQNRDITAQAIAFVDALRTQRHARMPVILFAHWPQFMATVRERMAQPLTRI